jgi:DNA-binding transcriptional MerR regulator
MEAVSLKKIGEVAEELGTTPRALRFYEEEGLIASRRTAGGTRLYSEEDIARFRGILGLAHAGIPVALIKDLATTREKFKTGQGASHGVHAILETLQATIREQIDALVRLESELSDAAKTIEGCYRCKKPPTRQACPNCPVNKRLETSEILNLIWEQSVEDQ